MLFSKGRLPHNLLFRYNGKELDIVTEFSHLGLLFSKTGNFQLAKAAQVAKALKAMFEVLKNGKLHNLSIQCQLDLFEKIIKPIFLYGSEIWDFSNNESIERVHLKFCKILLKLKMSTPNYMIYRELGLYPMDTDIKVQIISYWARLLTGKQSKLSFLIYKYMYNLSLSNNINFDQIEFVKGVFDHCGYT